MERKKIEKKKERKLSGEEKAFIERKKRETGKQGEREPGKEMEKKQPGKDRGGRKEKRAQREEEAPKGVPQVTDFAQRAEGCILAPQHHSPALELRSHLSSYQKRHRLSAPHPSCSFSYLPPCRQAVRSTPFLSLAPHFHPQPFLVPRALLPLPPMHPACFGASDSNSNQYPHHHRTKPAPTPPEKGGKKKQAAPPAALTPSRLIFSTVAPSPNAG